MLAPMRARWAFTLGTCAICAGLALSMGEASAQERPADIAVARELFREGLALSREQKWDEARAKLEKSLRLKQTPLTYYTLAVAEKNSGRHVAALEHFKIFLAQPQNAKTESFIPGAEKAVMELEQLVAEVIVTVTPPEVPELLVELDGYPVPTVALGRPRPVDSGAHEVTAKGRGFHPTRRSFTIEPRQSRAIELHLMPAPDEERPDDDTLFLAGLGLLAGGGAVAMGGLVVGIIGAEEASDAPTRDGPEADAALEKALAGDVLMGIGGATAVAGVVMLLVDLVDDGPSPRKAIRPWVHGDQLGLEFRF